MMACAAAIAAVWRRLPRRQAAPVSDEHIFQSINWWTLPTIREALTELMERGVCQAESSTRGILYRRSDETRQEERR